MPLFQNSVLNKYLNNQDQDLVKEKYQSYISYFHNPEIQKNIRGSKEEQFQSGFLDELFVKIFGYVLNPNPDFNLTTELKNEKGSKKVDGAIVKDGKAVAVIELKGTNTKDLDRVTDQAFGYKVNHPECVYVVTSNFERLRFYIENTTEYLEFDLFNLTEDQFKVIWFCLNAKNILDGLPLKAKQESVIEEEKITKNLYKDYSSFKNDLWQDIVKNSPELDQLLLYKKTQKLLDRFLFVLFAEDSGLLPPNSISRMVDRFETLKEEDAEKPLYEIFKQYFGYINTGRPGKTPQDEIFAYNGGLFNQDEILDSVTIDNDILESHVMKMTSYDFQSDVDVNILGHIFENSLNDIENVTAILEGQEVDKSKSKRKKDGVFYTPKYITKYIVDNTVGKLCVEKKAELKIIDDTYAKGRKHRDKKVVKKLDANLQSYRQWLLGITICDPACGSGAFLNQALEFLINEHSYIDELESQLLGYSFEFPGVENHILEQNIFGVDINEESVEIAKLSLWLRTAQRGRKLTSLNNNLKCGNSLIDDPLVAGDKAFNWENEFPEVFSNGGFDVVIGNPPYVAKSFMDSEKLYFNNKYSTAQYQLDLYISFMEIGVNNLKPEGVISYIVPNSWLKNLMFDKCRLFVLNNLHFEIIIPNLENVFSDASVDTLIFIASKAKSYNDMIEIGQFERTQYRKKHNVDQNRFLANNKLIFDVEISKESESIFKKIEKQCVRLEEVADITRGINPYDKYRGQAADVIKNKLYHSDYKKDVTFVPEIRGKHVNRYSLEWEGESYVSYGDWLAAPRDPKFFQGNRIICRQVLGTNLNCTFIDSEFIIDQSVFIAKFDKKQSEEIDPKFALAQLTSKLLSYFFRHKANEFDALFPKIKIGEFKLLPIKKEGIKEQQKFVDSSKLMLSLNDSFYKLNSKFQIYLKSLFSSIVINRKLQNWHELEFRGFIIELNKAIKKAGGAKVTRSDEMEWMELFEAKKAEAQELKDQINQTDKEIDQMVYELYGLTEDEIKIVEEN